MGRVDPEAHRPVTGRQQPQRAPADRRGVGGRQLLAVAGEKLAGQRAAALRPERDVRRERKLPGAVARRAALAVAVDLDHRGVRIDRHRLRRIAPERPVQTVPGARQTSLDRLTARAAKPLGQLQGGRRGGHLGDRTQRRARAIRAQFLDVIEALAADQLRLGQRDHQLTAGDAATALLDRRGPAFARQLGVHQAHQPRSARQLTHADQAGVRRQALLVGAKDDPSGVPVTVNARHPPGDPPSLLVAGISTRHNPGPTGRKPRTQRGFRVFRLTTRPRRGPTRTHYSRMQV
jgi:hypothetical protein